MFFQNGYAIELLKAENCAINGTAAYTVGTESTAFMTDDCDMVIRSCGDTLGYNTAMVNTFGHGMTQTVLN